MKTEAEKALEELEELYSWAKLAINMMPRGKTIPVISDYYKTIRQALERMAKSEWQDISTAPRDGSSILVVGGTACSDIGSPREVIEAIKVAWDKDGNFTEDEAGQYTPKGCWQVVDTSYYSIIVTDPTHWMPLPPTPITGDAVTSNGAECCPLRKEVGCSIKPTSPTTPNHAENKADNLRTEVVMRREDLERLNKLATWVRDRHRYSPADTDIQTVIELSTALSILQSALNGKEG